MNKNRLISTTVFCVVFGAGCLISSRHENDHVVEQKQIATQLAANTAFTIERQLSTSLSATKALEVVLRRYGDIPDFDRLAAHMVGSHGGISALELAPNGVIARVYPPAGNEGIIGHDLLNDPKSRDEAQAAIRTGELTLAGPFGLMQGGVGAVGRLPVQGEPNRGGRLSGGEPSCLRRDFRSGRSRAPSG